MYILYAIHIRYLLFISLLEYFIQNQNYPTCLNEKKIFVNELFCFQCILQIIPMIASILLVYRASVKC